MFQRESRRLRNLLYRYSQQLPQASMKRHDSLIRELEALTGIEIPFNGQGTLQLFILQAIATYSYGPLLPKNPFINA